jgi:hypothetical protein
MPKKQVLVRSHERRKPHKNARITIKYYIREEKVGKGRHRDLDKETKGIMVIEEELHPDYRYCERCGDHMDPKGMVRLQNGRWLCKGCDEVEKKEEAGRF